MKVVPLFFAFNNDYIVPAAVAFFSLLIRAKKDVFYKFFVIHTDISEESKDLINSALKKFTNFNIEYKNVKNFMLNEWQKCNWGNKNKGNKFTRETILKCFAPSLFPDCDKIIFSDVDVVFQDDISELIDIDLENQYIAAVKDFILKYSKDEIGHLPDEYYKKFKDSYFAGGILVMNLKKMRQDNFEQRICELIKDDNLDKSGLEQDLLNIACDNKVKYLPLNYIGYPYIEDYILKPDFESHFTRDEMYNSIINPKIIHYASVKPWNGVTNYSEHWWTIYRYLKLPKTNIFNKKHNKLKIRKKNIISGLLLILISLPFISKLFNEKNRKKLYKSIEKYKDI